MDPFCISTSLLAYNCLFSLVDTNADCSVLVFDAYYVAEFRTTAVAEYVLYLAYKLRSAWRRLLNQRLSRGLGQVRTLKRYYWDEAF